MSYGLSFEQTPAESVQRIRREQLEAAAEGLERGHDEDPVEAVHDARKRIKKTRSLLRLARPGLKPKAYRRRNRALRDTGRGLSGARDADVLAETVDGLAERFVGQLPEGFFSAARAPLAARAEAERKATDPGEHAAALRALAGDDWRLRGLSGDALAESLKRTYARGCEAFARADRKPTATNLHEWRKRVKDLWYQERLLQGSWPNVMKAQAKEAKKLSKLLGEDHDLAVLAEHVDDPQLLELLEQRRAELLERSRDLGRRIYAERPKAFARRARRYVDLAAA
jgi:CHAD domain-containing protein